MSRAQRLDDLVEELRIAVADSQWTAIVEISQEILAISPNHPRALYQIVVGACMIPEPAIAQKYAPKLTEKSRQTLQDHVCDKFKVDLTP